MRRAPARRASFKARTSRGEWVVRPRLLPKAALPHKAAPRPRGPTGIEGFVGPGADGPGVSPSRDYPAVAEITALNSDALSEAPPTRAPSTSSMAKMASALPGLTEPP